MIDLFMQFIDEMARYAPSLSDLSSVSQQINAYQARIDNPNLNAVPYYSTQLMAICDFTMKCLPHEETGRSCLNLQL